MGCFVTRLRQAGFHLASGGAGTLCGISGCDVADCGACSVYIEDIGITADPPAYSPSTDVFCRALRGRNWIDGISRV